MQENDLRGIYWRFAHAVDQKIDAQRRKQLKHDLMSLRPEAKLGRSDISLDILTALATWTELGLGRHVVEAVLLRRAVAIGGITHDGIVERYDDRTADLIDDLNKVFLFRDEHISKEAEGLRRLLLAVARDVRVLMIMIVERLVVMRHLGQEPDPETRKTIAQEVLDLYAPMAHRMGLYAIKTEMEDLGLKFTDYATYKDIARKLNEKKRERDAYIARFIEPVKQRCTAEGLKFDIKGRTKSIYSIWRKMVKQGCDVDGVYDLFAIRIIIDTDDAHAKSACWQAYAAVTDMYVPNTKRLRDWISVPKSNGYESLHITVMGPDGKWVEVQIRTRAMDEVAEKGVAAHWKYKGGKSDGEKSEEWLHKLRDTLEQSQDADSDEAREQFKMQLYDDDVFVFTPKGDLIQLKRGSTVLDLAYAIHSHVGETAVGAKVNGRHVQIGYVLTNGEQVEIITAANQKPKPDWLNIVVTAKARSYIKQKLRDMEYREAELGREIVERKARNWKIEFTDAYIDRAARHFGFDNARLFYVAVNRGEVDLIDVRDWMLEAQERDERPTEAERISVSNFTINNQVEAVSQDAIVIDGGVKGLEYELAKCCNPVYGDDVFGFVGAHGGIKIHRKDCPNARHLMERMAGRMVDVRWARNDDGTNEYTVTIRIIGNDDMGILNNITSVISKESGIKTRSIALNSQDGLFEGDISLIVHRVGEVEQLLRKLRTIKGVKQVIRI